MLLKEIDTNHSTSSVSCTYTPSIETYNIVTDNMTDDCKPTQLGNGCCIWLNEKGQLGEIECIYPKSFKAEISTYFHLDEWIYGTPSFEISSIDDDVVIEQIEDGYIIWLSSKSNVDLEVSQGGISYLLSGNKLSGIVAKKSEIIE
ncbi:hypothetical protein G7L40_01205 [Paenibacillus polymyxa]|uniref:Uncharacterized protein n=1 Tax=Paenibacillus polymyxa TaxID=1406 RepID=A0A378XW26_PAEPO|nr:MULTISPECIES: hypothetical protein [Paenibacillus]MBE7897326.1 hypothetical protein [Paenibacillus polymyxa]MCC3257425.1 hypothetical protein [Paenibacillus polymyxa]QPK56559.1 hypothetical protein G7L40_01205 [Paenibacillus polymyxa]RFT92101.1 hypothetical protein DX902_24620 [Paenibacillus jamilae]UOD88013.1 hypothetical protein CUU60_23595 [Paenibacillus polymyxa ATCC 842]